MTIVVDGSDAEFRAFLRAEHLPWNNVCVVLDPTDDNLVILANMLTPPALCDEVDGLGCSANEDDVFGGVCVEEVCNLLTSVLIGIGSTGG